MPVSDKFLFALDAEMSALVGSSIDQMWARAKEEFLGEWERLSRQNLTDPDMARRLETFIEELSLKPVDKLARQGSTVAYSQGRNATTLTAEDAGEVFFVVRSEVLDTNTCRPCSILDGEIFAVGSSEYFANMPPSQCDGGDFCRGIYIAISGEG